MSVAALAWRCGGAGGLTIETADREVIQACLAGDQRAWASLVERYAPLVRSIPRRMGMRDDECEDVSQTVFIILLRRLTSLRDVESLPKWLMTTTRRECLRALKRRSVLLGDAEAPDEAVAAGASGPGGGDLPDTAPLHAALASIGERCHRLLALLFMMEPAPDYSAISTALGMPIGSIGPTRARCLAKLHQALAADGEGQRLLEAFGAVL